MKTYTVSIKTNTLEIITYVKIKANDADSAIDKALRQFNKFYDDKIIEIISVEE